MKKAFTLIEMMIVIAIAVSLLAMSAGALKSMNAGSGTALAGGTIQATLNKARVLAMKEGTPMYVYFIDPGIFDTPPSGVPQVGLTAGENFMFYNERVYLAPGELAIVNGDTNEIISTSTIPESVTWVSHANRGLDSGNNPIPDFHFTPSSIDLGYLNRASTLRVKFLPDGSARLKSTGGVAFSPMDHVNPDPATPELFDNDNNPEIRIFNIIDAGYEIDDASSDANYNRIVPRTYCDTVSLASFPSGSKENYAIRFKVDYVDDESTGMFPRTLSAAKITTAEAIQSSLRGKNWILIRISSKLGLSSTYGKDKDEHNDYAPPPTLP